MRKHIFYGKYANTPLSDRDSVLTEDARSDIQGMTLHDIYIEIQEIDNKLRSDEIRRDELLRDVEPFLTPR